LSVFAERALFCYHVSGELPVRSLVPSPTWCSIFFCFKVSGEASGEVIIFLFFIDELFFCYIVAKAGHFAAKVKIL
jgi:hypothetical protein